VVQQNRKFQAQVEALYTILNFERMQNQRERVFSVMRK
jgi:hypothetical protein